MEAKKRESWETEETKYFLHLIRERQVLKCLDSKEFRADEIFKHLEKSMHEKGYKKNWKQMQTRFKTLRQRYNEIKRKMGKSGSGNYLASFPYATEMSELLDSRPIAIEESIDIYDLSEDSNDLNNTNLCVPEDPLSIFLNEKTDSNDFAYEGTPDLRDGAIPSCSKHIYETTITQIIKTCIATHLVNVKHMLMQSIAQLLRVFDKRRRYLVEIILMHLLNKTSPNQLLDIGPILRLSQERTIWMKERSKDWWERIVKDHFKEEDWLESFRMRKNTFMWLCDQLKNEIAPCVHQIGFREPVSVEKQVAVCLFFLSSCCEYRVVGNVFGIHKSTVWKCVHKVVDAINTKLMHQWIYMPDNNECQQISMLFEQKTHIPQLIGAIDGTHIPILPPSDGYRDYINRKGWPSVILQAVVDNTYKFRNIFCGAPGACHDAAVFKNSKLYKNNNSLIPHQTKMVLNTPIPYLIIGDPAYPLLEWLIKGYTKNTRLTSMEESFNVYLNSGRVCVEIAFGRLKARWRRLLKRNDVHYSYVSNIISACCILHNILETHNERYITAWENIVHEVDLQFQQPQSIRTRDLNNFNGSLIRDVLKDYLAENFELRSTFPH